MKLVGILSLLLAFFSLLSMAAGLEIELAQSSYLPGETFQAELTGNFTKPLSIDNIFFYAGPREIAVSFHLEQIAINKWFVWADLPPSFGEHTFAVYALENGLSSANVTFTIKKPIAFAYSWLSDQVEEAWPVSSVDNALALLALSYDSRLADLGKSALLGKGTQCWPTPACRVKDTALALLALNKIASPTEEVENWLTDSQNSLEIGEWDIIITSPMPTTCSLKAVEETNISIAAGTNSIALDLAGAGETAVVELDCNRSVEAKVVHTYRGKVHEFLLIESDGILTLSLSNKHCWGPGYRTECSAEATAYALFALSQFGFSDEQANAWLRTNATSTVERAFAYLLTADLSIESWLLNNQAVDGYWSTQALVLTTDPDVISTATALLALSSHPKAGTESAISKARAWLLQEQQARADNSFGSLAETAFVLANIFTADQIEPIMAVEPAIITTKSESTFTLLLKNRGILNTNALLAVEELGISESLLIEPGDAQSVVLEIPFVEKDMFTTVDISYSTILSEASRSYKLPLLVLTKIIVNETIENVTLLPARLSFVEELINQSLLAGENATLIARLHNPSDYALEGIEITISWGLLAVMQVSPMYIERIEANQSANISITITGETPMIYSGVIEAETDGITTSLPVSIAVEAPEVELLNCAELGGKICVADEICDGETVEAADGACCLDTCKPKEVIPEEEKPKPGKIVGIVLLVVAVLALVAFLLIRLLRKPKKEISAVLARIEERYKGGYR